MPNKSFDYKGLSCPTPLLKLSVALMKQEVSHGEIIDIAADCPFFVDGLKKWCEQTKSVLLKLRAEEKGHLATVRVG